MKARHILSKEAKADYHEQVFYACAGDILAQTLAQIMWTLAVEYGWGKRRMRKFADAVKRTVYDTEHKNPITGRKVDPVDMIAFIRDEYGIDIVAEFPAHVETRGG